MTASEATARHAIAAFLRVDEAELVWDAPLTDAVSDSFVLVDLAVHLQQEFAVRLEHTDLAQVTTPADLASLIAARSAAP